MGKEDIGSTFLHAFSGCDSTALDFKKSKITPIKGWISSSYIDEVTKACRLLSWLPIESVFELSLPTVHNFVKSVFAGNGLSKQLRKLSDFRANASNV